MHVSFGKEIYTLLLQHDIVIIPGLGAFVSEYHPAEISDDSDEIKPPSKNISFNPDLKNNDGLLVGHIAEKLHISHFNALVRIEKERDEMLFKLDKGDEVFVEGVGTLSHDEQGAIVFQESLEENMLLDSFGFEPMSISEPEQAEPPLEDPEPVSETEEPEQTEEEVPNEAPATEEEKPAEQTEPKKTAPVANSERKEEKKRKPWLFLLIIIPLLAVAVFVFIKGFNNGTTDKNEMSSTTVAEELPEEQEVVVPDSLTSDSLATTVQDTSAVSDTVKTAPEPIETIAAEQDSIKYYLVGGSFSVKENADAYLNELQEKGYEAFHVGKKGRFFIIGINSYKTFSEAEAAKEIYLNDNPGSEVWVYRK